MTVKKVNENNYELDCNYMEITAIEYSLSCVKKIIIEQEAVVGVDSIVKLEDTVILKVINEMILKIRDNV
jgi:hypothetical protein